ncbi:MAG TPA: type VI secretion system accessory protein TagJ, partial [Rhizomicrobium sp.]
MEQADRLLKSGDLAGARAALVQAVRERPGDVGARMFLFQLLAVAGEWDKAETQVRALAQTTPEAQMLATVYGQAIAAERARALAFQGKAPFPLLLETPDWLQKLAAALEAFSKNDAVLGEDLRGQAFDAAPEVAGAWNGDRFERIADADARFGPALEAVIGGRWGLIGWDEIAALKSEGPADLRDIVWLPVEMTFRSGRSAAG